MDAKAVSPVGSGGAPPFTGAPDLPLAEAEFPFVKMFETRVSHAGVGAAVGVVPVPVDLPAVAAGFAPAAGGAALPLPKIFETALCHEGFAAALGVVAAGLAGATVVGIEVTLFAMAVDAGVAGAVFAAAACCRAAAACAAVAWRAAKACAAACWRAARAWVAAACRSALASARAFWRAATACVAA